MRILIAEDDPVSRRLLQATLARWGYTVIPTADGEAAWNLLQHPDAPPVAILDWMMPLVDGVELCRRVRERRGERTYLILLTARGRKEDILTGLEAGANDYVTKPFDRDELHARLKVGLRVVELQRSLAARVAELEQALAQVKHLEGILPICTYCKRIRDDANYWQKVEAYISARTEAQFSHGVCPECYEKILQPELDRHRRRESEKAG